MASRPFVPLPRARPWKRIFFTAPAAAQNLTIPDTGLGGDVFQFVAATQTITNKTVGDALLFANLGATPSNPAAGNLAVYSKTDQLCSLTSGGTEVCFSAGGGGTTAISSLLAAAGANTINNGDNLQRWNFFLTTAAKIGLRVSENTASTATTNAALFGVDTIAASTANTVQFTAKGTANGVRLPPNGFWTAIGFDGVSGFDMNTSPLTQECTNEGTTGTTAHLLAKLNTSNQCIKLTTSDVGAIEGIVVAGAGTTGKALIAVAGQADCTFDGVTVVNDIVVASVTSSYSTRPWSQRSRRIEPEARRLGRRAGGREHFAVGIHRPVKPAVGYMERRGFSCRSPATRTF